MAYYLFVEDGVIRAYTAEELRSRPEFDADSPIHPLGELAPDAWQKASSLPEFAGVPAKAVKDDSKSPSKKTILVVDDDPSIREIVTLCAQRDGFNVVSAVNGLDAAAKAEKTPLDLIITDLMMPQQGGYEFLRGLQTSGNGRTPVFVISAAPLNQSTVDMIRGEANVVEFIQKPLRMPLFVAMLHKHLQTTPSVSPRAARRVGDFP